MIEVSWLPSLAVSMRRRAHPIIGSHQETRNQQTAAGKPAELDGNVPVDCRREVGEVALQFIHPQSSRLNGFGPLATV
ncbi:MULTISPECIES: hypothetical protein [Bradyrhizobium]|uniref:hypothetical protein n=1 Tax=Bradyrhizobium TaxID=374 RepID=UPI000FE14AA5|nr:MULTISPECIES: hypothetical protein [Bradyrhizobium]